MSVVAEAGVVGTFKTFRALVPYSPKNLGVDDWAKGSKMANI